MRATLTFNLPEEEQEFLVTSKAGSLQAAIWDVGQEVFRPARKHGYPDSALQALVEANDGAAEEIISKLEQLFHEILCRHNVDDLG